MRKILLALVITLSVIFFSSAQSTNVSYTGRYIDINFGTVANSVTETYYVSIDGWTKIDSISVVACGIGELDVDSIDMYVGYGGGIYSSTAITATVTLDLADGVAGWQNIVSSNATQLTGAALRGVKAIKVVSRGATAGNDATDASQNFHVVFQIWGTKS